MYYYLASPYSHKDKNVMKVRHDLTMIAVENLLRYRIPAFSPIVHCHELAQRGDMPKDFGFWKAYNYQMLSQSIGLLILEIYGWSFSSGVCGERNDAGNLGLGIVQLEDACIYEPVYIHKLKAEGVLMSWDEQETPDVS